MARIHDRWTPTDLLDLIRAYPLATMVSHGAGDGAGEFAATPLPILPDVDEAGRLIRLVGHMSLANEQVEKLRANPAAYFLFHGPQGYVSPRLVPDRTWAPTWNYILVRVSAEVKFRPDQNDAALRRLVATMEAGHPDAWSVEQMGERYERISGHVIAFDATVTSVHATFKLGQDEKPLMFESMLAGLDQPELKHWMRRFRAPRPES
jgi:transcriptional regulator